MARSLSYCTKQFVMWLDADDRISRDDALRRRELLWGEPDWDVLHLPYQYSRSARKMPARFFRNGIGKVFSSEGTALSQPWVRSERRETLGTLPAGFTGSKPHGMDCVRESRRNPARRCRRTAYRSCNSSRLVQSTPPMGRRSSRKV